MCVCVYVCVCACVCVCGYVRHHHNNITIMIAYISHSESYYIDCGSLEVPMSSQNPAELELGGKCVASIETPIEHKVNM